MSEDHEKWLSKQGVKITGRHTLRRTSIPPYMLYPKDEPIDWAPMETISERVYQVELDERTIERLQRHEAMVTNAIEHASRLNRQGQFNSIGQFNTSGVVQYFIDNSNRHHELLKENPMYRDAWKEFQSIRVLLGETPHWP
jgi:hypothetical protein